jgi:hypothetical protein
MPNGAKKYLATPSIPWHLTSDMLDKINRHLAARNRQLVF